MAGAAPQQGGSENSGMGPLWVAAAAILGFLVIWTHYHTQIMTFLIRVRLYEAIGISFFTDSIDPMLNWLKTIPPSQYGNLTPDQLDEISKVVGSYFRYPLAIFVIIVSIFIYKKSPVLRFRRVYSMQALVDEEESEWPQITPVAKLDLVKVNLDEGPWASGMTPLQFVKKHKIFKELPVESSEPTLAHKQKFYVSLLSEPAHSILSLQLGKPWAGVSNLPIYAQALFAVFAARAAKDTKTSTDFLIQISRSSASGKLDFTGLKSLLNKHSNQKQVQEVCRSYAYALTVMASMLQLAREDGVLSTADFLWLKPLDRSLWYMLNSVGRQTPYVEVAGPFAHWKAEFEFGRPIVVPMVQEAVKALDLALKEILYLPDDK